MSETPGGGRGGKPFERSLPSRGRVSHLAPVGAVPGEKLGEPDGSDPVPGRGGPAADEPRTQTGRPESPPERGPSLPAETGCI